MTNDPIKDLVFFERPDLTPFLIHLTKNTKKEDDFSALNNLISILKLGEIWGSDTTKGFVKGPNKAACFMDVPFTALKFILNKQNTLPDNPRYEPYGIVISKGYAYGHGCRPVLYLSNDELSKIGMPSDELWRVVRFESRPEGMVNWIHEREWRCKGALKLPNNPYAVLVKTPAESKELTELIASEPDEFKAKPQSIIPIQIMCQGLPYMNEKKA